MYGHEDMIDYLSTYRWQEKFKGKHHVPRGALFWFTCNSYGDLTGSCYFIKNVPDMELMGQSYMGTGYRKHILKKKEVRTLPKVLCDDERLAEHILKEKKLKLHQ